VNKSKQYNLNFGFSNFEGINFPEIGTPIINGSSKNCEIASFLQSNGIELIEHIRYEINSFNYNVSFKDHTIWGYHDAESIEVRNLPPNPAVVIFNTGGTEVEVPVSDFLQILDEWEAFVNSVPKPHWLENR
jgi:hypothetical protein